MPIPTRLLGERHPYEAIADDAEGLAAYREAEQQLDKYVRNIADKKRHPLDMPEMHLVLARDNLEIARRRGVSLGELPERLQRYMKEVEERKAKRAP